MAAPRPTATSRCRASALPRLNSTRDIAPFAALADAEAAMTAHIVYEAWDPDRPATCSPAVIEEIIRGRIGFQGLLMSDDLDMKALQFATQWRAWRERAEAALEAGCDVVLQCSGALTEMRGRREGLPRAQRPCAGSRPRGGGVRQTPAGEFDAEAGWARFKQVDG